MRSGDRVRVRSCWGSSGQVYGKILRIENHNGKFFAVLYWTGKYASKMEEKLGYKFPLDELIKVNNE